MNISEALAEARMLLQEAGVLEASREASSLLAYTLHRERSFLIAHPEYELALPQKSEYESYLKRRANHEPFQYIVGRQEFYGLEFEVSPYVLIPRPETELLVEAAINHLRLRKHPRFCEIGIGSGCISIAILHELSDATAIGGDISTDALAVARRNAAKHNVDGQIEFKISDVFENILEEPFDAILSNPPYVPERDFESLQAEVRDFEPTIALTAGPDGLSIIDRIVRESRTRLAGGGALIMEIGFNQMTAVEHLFDKGSWTAVEFWPDLQNIPRIVVAKR
jgi:release factor glutamine methyltransferase